MVRNQKDLFRIGQEKQGGIVPSQLKADQSVLVETCQYVYKITKEGQHWFVDSGHDLVRHNSQIVNISSTDPVTSCYMPDWIGKGMLLELTTPYGLTIITKEVESALIQGKNFEMNLWD